MSLTSGRSFHCAPGSHPPFPFFHDTWNGGSDHFQHLQLSLPPMMSPTRIDWNDTPDAHVFKADLPGFHKHDVKVEIEEERVLCISGEKKTEKGERMGACHHVERATSKFTRRFHLPENAMVDKLAAHFENEILSVTIPKKEIKKHHGGHVRIITITGN